MIGESCSIFDIVSVVILMEFDVLKAYSTSDDDKRQLCNLCKAE